MYMENDVRRVLNQVLIENGFSKEDSEITADVLLDGTLRGYDNHGIERIFQIIDGVKFGTLNTSPKRGIVNEGLSFSVIDGDYGLGQPSAVDAVKVGIEKAKETGIAIVGVLNSGHIGILSYYTELASAENCLCMGFTTSSPASIVPGGNKAIFGTNPISYSFPVNSFPVTADFSTTAVSRGTLFEYKENNKTIPNGWAVDSDGRITNSPDDALKGGILPYGGEIKGTLLSMLVATLAGPLIGGVANHKVTGTRYMNEYPNKSDVFICIDISKFTEIEHFTDENCSLFKEILENSSNFHIPGSGAYERKKGNGSNPIRMSEKFKKLMDDYSEVSYD